MNESTSNNLEHVPKYQDTETHNFKKDIDSKTNLLESDLKSNQKEESVPSSSFFELFRFASKKDKVIMAFAALFSSIQGFLLPGMMLIFGDFSENMTDAVDPQAGKEKIIGQVLIMIYLGIAVFVTSSIANIMWTVTGQNQMVNLRSEYFKHIIMKNASWYDKERPGKLASAYYEHLSMFVQIYGNKMHVLCQILGMTISSVAVGLYKGWSLSLLIIAVSPLMVIGMAFFLLYIGKATKMEKEAYIEAGSVSDQAFEYIRSIKSLKGEEHEHAKYVKSLDGVLKSVKTFSCKISALYGFMNFCWQIVYPLSFLFGNIVLGKKWFNDNSGKIYSVGDYLTILFAITTGVSGFGILSPILKTIGEAKVAMGRINQIVNNQNLDRSGTQKPDKQAIRGRIQFENVTFAYPTHPDKKVLKNVSFTISPGEKFAIVGPSGSGKSTIIQLLERFYDPQEGRILLDGVDIRDIEVEHFRGIVGLVSQQPVLFADTIRNNLVIGMEQRPQAITDEEIWESLERANVRGFIENKLEDKLETYVGNLGGQLSGGQKQRVSIARVLLRNPNVFLFDEATSALDRQNEKEIQETIDQVCTNVTSVSIAHRLQTIKNSDQIIVLVDGEVCESGPHERLMEIENGVYKGLYLKQDKSGYEGPVEEEDVKNDAENGNESGVENNPKYSEKKLNGSERVTDNNHLNKEIHSEKNDINPDKNKDKEDEADKKKKEKKKEPVFLLTSMDYLDGKSIGYILLGVLCSGLAGAIMPFLGYYLGKVLAVFGQYDLINNDASKDSQAVRDALWDKGMEFTYVMGAIIVGGYFCYFFQTYFFGLVANNYVLKVRNVLFRKFIYRDIEYFDQPENKPGNLSAKLSTDCNFIKTLVSNYLGSILEALTSFIIGLVFGFVFSWRITLLVIGLSPLLILSGIVDSMMFMGAEDSSGGVKEDENVVQESFNNIKMVKSLVAEQSIYNKYMEDVKVGDKKVFRRKVCFSFLLGVSQFGQFVVFGLIFYAAAVWRINYNLDMEKLFTAIFALIFGVYGAGMANHFVGDVGKMQIASKKIFRHINEIPQLEYDRRDPLYQKAAEVSTKNKDMLELINKVQLNQEKNEKRIRPELKGDIEFRNVWFKFPTRKTFALRGLNLTFKAGSNCAIVGASGSGKSTIFQLLMRFYDPSKGEIFIDGHEIRTIDLEHLRSFFGLIKQEPEIFNGTIGYNIVYNCEGKTEAEIQKACDTSNSQEFIELHNEGRERHAGNRGDALSGGQKQRLTIARVLLKSPQVYLFDEATSALDSNSEKVVQDAIEKIWGSHSSLTIAHRFSTIKNCDRIFVIEKGKVVEKGTYDELMMQKGVFFDLAVE